ncbi:MAG: hypothetical protein SFX18_15245 [Pirellulales bacterium]|nr:hypothetical protein [Pirellulales bacterium]
MLGDLKNPRWMYLKAVLFVLIGLIAATLLLLEHPSWYTAGLLLITIWAFCRAYYFAFYVIEKYIDPRFRFAGLWSVLRYLLTERKADSQAKEIIAKNPGVETSNNRDVDGYGQPPKFQ